MTNPMQTLFAESEIAALVRRMELLPKLVRRQQEELIQMIRGRQSAMDRQRIAEQIVRLNKVTPTGLKNYC